MNYLAKKKYKENRVTSLSPSSKRNRLALPRALRSVLAPLLHPSELSCHGGHPHGATVYTGDTGKLEPVLQVLQRCAIKDPKRATLLRAKGPSCLTLCCRSDLQNFQSHILRESVYERVRY